MKYSLKEAFVKLYIELMPCYTKFYNLYLVQVKARSKRLKALTKHKTLAIQSFPLLFGILFWSCTEPFDDVKKVSTESRIVVESFISDVDNFSVRLTETTDFPSTEDIPAISGAEVYIINDLEDTVSLTENTDGKYESSEVGVVDRSYKLRLVIGAKTYESPFVKLLAPVTIDDLYIKQDPDQDDEYFAFACIEDDANSSDFYVWFYDTYKKDGTGQIDENKTDISFNVFNDRLFNGFSSCLQDSLTPQVNNLAFESIDTFLVLQQYHVDKDASIFWAKMALQTQFVGGPFDVPPSPIVGNVRNIENQNDYLLGYFMVAGKDVDTVIVPTIE